MHTSKNKKKDKNDHTINYREQPIIVINVKKIRHWFYVDNYIVYNKHY